MTWRSALAAQPRTPLGQWPTPLQRAPRLSAELGIELWIKRDDIGSIGLAGNKVRKLEFAIGAALAEGADCLVTIGAPQSNHCRATAAVGAQLGLETHLVFKGTEPSRTSGNLLLDRLFGAHVHYGGDVDWSAMEHPIAALIDELRAAGKTPAMLPAGCSSPVGALGFVAAYDELLCQLDDQGIRAKQLFHAATSGGTHAGLALGCALHDRGPAIVGLEVGMLYPDVGGYVAYLATEAADMLGSPRAFGAEDFALPADQLGSGYGAFTPATTEAIKLAAQLEGLVFDPVYSGKALAGVIARARAGELTGPVVLWHTGGAPSIFADGWADPLLDAQY